MAKDPAFLFYPGDYVSGTMGMTFEEKGAYMDLLMLQFNRGHMNTHMIQHTVGHLWEQVKCKFIQDQEGLWYNIRLDVEKDKRKTFTESRRNNMKPKNKSKDEPSYETHMQPHMDSHMENIELLVTKPELLMTKNESKNKNLGKYNKKSIYLNLGKYGYFLNYNKLNYKIPEWLPPEKIDLEIASNLIEYKIKYAENKGNSNESD